MVPEPADAGHCLFRGVTAQAFLAQRRARQDRSRIAILDDRDCHRRATVIFGEGALAHRNLWRRLGTVEGTHAGGVRRPTPRAARAPRPKRDVRALAPLALI
eukprot:9605617-Alexandrium_andersonii.AAC.1